MSRIQQALCKYPTQARLHKLLHYEASTGHFYWLIGNRKGHRAGNFSKQDGYIRIQIDNKNCLAHILVWIYIKGKRPTSFLDHINTIGRDNRLSNLRLATLSQNAANSHAYYNNRSGYKGVILQKNGQYSAQIKKNNKSYYLGWFDNPIDAQNAYLEKAKELHGEYARAGAIPDLKTRPLNRKGTLNISIGGTNAPLTS